MSERHAAINSDDDPLFVKNDALASALLDRAYVAQVKFFFPRELSLFHCCDRWKRAASVLDVGTGNGYFLQCLARVFRSKQYTAIDTDAAQLSIASASNFTAISFNLGAAIDVTESYDAILLRFVAQHMTDLTRNLLHLRNCLRPDGTIYITEGDDAATFFDPEPRRFREMFRVLAEQRRTVGADLDVGKTIPSAAASAGFEIIDTCEMCSTSTESDGRERMLEMELAILAYLKHANAFDFDYAKAGVELIDWYSAAEPYGEETLQMFKLRAV